MLQWSMTVTARANRARRAILMAAASVLLGLAGAVGISGAEATVTKARSAVGAQSTCAWRDTPISAGRLREVSISSVCLMNDQRVRAGLQPLRVDPRLWAAAEGHARDEAARNFFSHTNPDGCDPSCRAQAAGYPVGAGENLFAGVTTAAQAVDGWMNSPGHRANILSAGYQTLGSGTAMGGPYGTQWVQTFGAAPAPITAATGLEPAFQGAADPDRDGSATQLVAADLKVSGAKITHTWRLKLTATLTRRADGGRVRVRVRGRGRSVTYTARIAGGRARLNRKLPRRVRASRMRVTVSYAGNGSVRADSVKLKFS